MSGEMDNIDKKHLALTPEAAVDLICKQVIVAAAESGRRIIVGLAGGPGSGKSTLASAVVGKLNDRIDGSAARVPMDGFHKMHADLVAQGIEEEKGAPHTFDAQGYVDFLLRLKTARGPIQAPSYSRRIEDVVPNAFTIAGNVPILVAEGNYLLLDTAPWNRIKHILDLSFFLQVDRDLVRQRLLKRHAEHELFTEEQIVKHVDEVDMANYDLVAKSQRRADVVIDLVTEV